MSDEAGFNNLIFRAAEAVFPHRFLASQLRRPSGRFGRWVVTATLNRGNADLILATVDALALRQDDVFMDIGFGGGRAIELAAQRTSGALWGVDFSADVVAGAARRFAALIIARRLNLLTADVSDLPLRDSLIDAICTTNTIYFWPDPARALQSLRRVLRSGGRLAIGYTGAVKMRQFNGITQHGFTLYEPERVEALLREAGFRDIHTRAHSGKVTRGDFTTTAVAP
jgi:SAM-dependent methyltransferase